MNTRICVMHSAVIATLLTACSLQTANAVAIASPPAPGKDVRTIVVDTNTSVETSQDTADVVIAQSGADNIKREVRIITSGQHLNLPDMPDVNVIVSNAMAEAFAGGAVTSMAKNVKNAPYSAEVIAEKIQMLPDGNQITKKTSTLSFRDSAGRTRQEIRDSKGEVRSIQIRDAVEGTRYTLLPSTKTAIKIGGDKELQKRIEVIREKAKAMSGDGTAHTIEHSSRPGEEIIVKRVEIPDAEGKKGVREEVKVNVMRFGGGDPKLSASESGASQYSFNTVENSRMALSEFSPLNPLGNLFMDSKWSSKSITTPLGAKDFDGVRAEGKSVSYSIPAGEIGNKNPIVVSTETWTSPELQVVVYSKHSDPRTGDSIYRLANVKRGEQPASLFVIPEGYSVRETPGMAVKTKQK